jgi:hypothetical protein
MTLGTGLWDEFFLKQDAKGNLAGLEIGLLNALSQKAGFTYDLCLHKWNASLSWSANLQEALLLFDMVTYGYWAITEERVLVGAYSPHGFLDLSYILIAPKQVADTELMKDMFQLMQPFSAPVWGVIGVAIIATGLLYLSLEGGSNEDDLPGNDRKQRACDALCLSFHQLAQAGSLAPKTFPGKVLLASWAWCAMLIVASYTANLASFLTVKQTHTGFTDIHEAVRQKKKICMLENIPLHEWFDSKFSQYKEVVLSDSFATQKLAIKSGKCQAVLMNRFEFDLLTADPAVDPACTWQIVGQPIRAVKGGYMMINDHTQKCTAMARDILTHTFMEMVRDGHIDVATQMSLRNLGFENECKRKGAPVSTVTNTQLGVRNMAGVFILHCLGCGLAVIAYFMRESHKEVVRRTSTRDLDIPPPLHDVNGKETESNSSWPRSDEVQEPQSNL